MAKLEGLSKVEGRDEDKRQAQLLAEGPQRTVFVTSSYLFERLSNLKPPSTGGLGPNRGLCALLLG